VEAVALPMSVRQVASVLAALRQGARPTWERLPELRDLRGQLPTRAQARVQLGPAPVPMESPRSPGPTWKVVKPADPNWAQSPEERRQSGRPGSARAHRRAAPTSPRCQDVTARQPAVAEKTGAPAAPPSCAFGGGA